MCGLFSRQTQFFLKTRRLTRKTESVPKSVTKRNLSDVFKSVRGFCEMFDEKYDCCQCNNRKISFPHEVCVDIAQ